MANEPQSEKQKPKMVPEEDYLKLKVQLGEKLRGQHLTYEIKHGFTSHGNHLCPEVNLKIIGGDTAKVHALALGLEKLILEFAVANAVAD